MNESTSTASPCAALDLGGRANPSPVVRPPSTVGHPAVAAPVPADGDAERDIARGIAQSEFIVYYQPVVEAADLTVVATEALLRWNHAERGILRPEAFIASAERTGQILTLDRIALGLAARQVSAWARSRHGPSSVSVNLSAMHFCTADPLGPLMRTLRGAQCPAHLIDLELTENVLIGDVESAIRAMNAASALGMSLTIDDFGVEYAALNYLRRLPASGLKIDRSFVVDLDNHKTRTIVTSMIRLAHCLDLTVTAEGIETRAQEHFLRGSGCDYLQGYRYGAPMPAQDLQEHVGRLNRQNSVTYNA
ncbi:MAG: EAL domain-containing protein [Pseudomonadota bacterium]